VHGINKEPPVACSSIRHSHNDFQPTASCRRCYSNRFFFCRAFVHSRYFKQMQQAKCYLFEPSFEIYGFMWGLFYAICWTTTSQRTTGSRYDTGFASKSFINAFMNVNTSVCFGSRAVLLHLSYGNARLNWLHESSYNRSYNPHNENNETSSSTCRQPSQYHAAVGRRLNTSIVAISRGQRPLIAVKTVGLQRI
jgi:hypothetical protein